jgi:hypothetical protein
VPLAPVMSVFDVVGIAATALAAGLAYCFYRLRV